MKFDKYTKEELQDIINKSTSICEVLKKIGYSPKGYNHTEFTKYLKENNFNTQTLVGRHIKRYNDKGVSKKKLSEVLIENGSGNSTKLKDRLINEGVKEYKCEKCGNVEWNGMPIPLELHHINGNHYDNRLMNLIILCPNCHVQTSNFRGRHLQYDKELADIAESRANDDFKLLLDREKDRSEEIYRNKLKYREISLHIKPIKEKKYCEVCGKEIIGKGKRFCSHSCSEEANRKNTYDKNDIINKAKNVNSLIQLSKYYNITDNALKKQMKRLNIFEEVKNIINNNKLCL